MSSSDSFLFFYILLRQQPALSRPVTKIHEQKNIFGFDSWLVPSTSLLIMFGGGPVHHAWTETAFGGLPIAAFALFADGVSSQTSQAKKMRSGVAINRFKKS